MSIEVIPRRLQGRITQSERWRTGRRFGELMPQDLTTILDEGAKGDLTQYASLVKWAVKHDDLLSPLFETRRTKIAAQPWRLGPPPGMENDPLAIEGARFCSEALNYCEDFDAVRESILDSASVGVSCHEMEWEYVDGIYVVRNFHWRHPRRFRYDENFALRLFDRKSHTGQVSSYGELLDPRLWIIHHFQVEAGPPSEAGLFRSVAWKWLFRRWADKFWIHGVEKWGSPIIYAKVPKSSPGHVRDDVKLALENLSYDHVGVFEEGGEIVLHEAAKAANDGQMYKIYMDELKNSLVTAILGHADAVSPGENGSQSAVSVRSEDNAMPRELKDAKSVWSAIRRGYFRNLLAFNAHRFGGRLPPTPIELYSSGRGLPAAEPGSEL